MDQRRSGFSFLEISVSIAIVGLIAGAILAGQSFVKRQELRRVITDANSYVLAIQQFQIKYNWLPGDFPTATAVWGRVHGSGTDSTPAAECANAITLESNGKKTCNGDGNGMIEQTNCEYYRAWQQLAAGEYIQGNFVGTSGKPSCNPNSVVYTNSGVNKANIPGGAMDGTGYSLNSFGAYDASSPSTVYYDGDYKNAILFGGTRVSDVTNGPALIPAEAQEIDTKVDDGTAALGNVRALKSTSVINPEFTIGNNYKNSNSNKACSLLFMDTYMNKNNR